MTNQRIHQGADTTGCRGVDPDQRGSRSLIDAGGSLDIMKLAWEPGQDFSFSMTSPGTHVCRTRINAKRAVRLRVPGGSSQIRIVKQTEGD